MNTELMKVVQQGEAFAVQSQKAEGGQIKKCNILLQELGGKFENQFAAQLWGNAQGEPRGGAGYHGLSDAGIGPWMYLLNLY